MQKDVTRHMSTQLSKGLLFLEFHSTLKGKRKNKRSSSISFTVFPRARPSRNFVTRKVCFEDARNGISEKILQGKTLSVGVVFRSCQQKDITQI